MKFIEIYYFEGDVPSLEEVCARIKQEYQGDVEVEIHSHRWGVFGSDGEDEEQGLKNMFKDTMGIAQNTVLMQDAILKSNGEAIQLSTYTSQFKPIRLESCHTKNTYELYELAGQVLKEFGGKIKEVKKFTEDEKKKQKREGGLLMLLFLSKIALFAAFYFYFKLTVLQLLAIIGVYLIIKNGINFYFSYKAAKKSGWL